MGKGPSAGPPRPSVEPHRPEARKRLSRRFDWLLFRNDLEKARRQYEESQPRQLSLDELLRRAMHPGEYDTRWELRLDPAGPLEMEGGYLMPSVIEVPGRSHWWEFWRPKTAYRPIREVFEERYR